MMKKLLLGLILLASCSSDKEPMDEWEQKMSTLLESDYIELYDMNKTTSIDGESPKVESFLEMDVYNSGVINKIIFNDRVLTNKCREIRDSILKIPSLNQFPEFREIRIKILETEETKTIYFTLDGVAHISNEEED